MQTNKHMIQTHLAWSKVVAYALRTCSDGPPEVTKLGSVMSVEPTLTDLEVVGTHAVEVSAETLYFTEPFVTCEDE